MKRNILLGILLLFFVGCTQSINEVKSHLYGQENAVWTESLYLRGYRPNTKRKLIEKDIETFALTLKSNKIKYAYLFAGPFQKDGHLPSYPFSEDAKNSVIKMQRLYPELIVLPWIGGIQNKTVFLEDSTWVDNALKDTKRLVERLGVPGVHIDFEYIVNGNRFLDYHLNRKNKSDDSYYGFNVNSFHEKLRILLPDSFISSVVVSTAPDTKPWKRKTTFKELSVLVKHVDQLSFLFYDTKINDKEIFQNNCIYQINDMHYLKRVNPNIQLLIAVGTFVNEPALREYRDLDVENIANSLNVIRNSVNKVSPSKRIVDGIAIYSDWETEEKEWKNFRKLWVDMAQ